MKIADILALPFEKAVNLLSKDEKHDSNAIQGYRDQYSGVHAILKRPDKTIGKEGKKTTVPTVKDVITQQKFITDVAVSFVFGKPVLLVNNTDGESSDTAFDALKSVWRQNKMEYFNRKLMRDVCIETKAAELWFVRGDILDSEDGKKTITNKQIKVILLSKKNGDDIYAHFDETGDMDAFTRRYESVDEQGKKVQHAEIYTAGKKIVATKTDGKTWEDTETPNIFGKIPVVYYEQEETEWAGVQRLIERLELLISRLGDTNDYFGDPAVVTKGRITTMPEKGEIGKLFALEGQIGQDGKVEYGDVNYLTWDQSPESVKLEYDILTELIYSMTMTPDISFDNVKSLGDISGVALKLIFLAPLLKANDKQEIYGEGIERRNNLLKAMLSVVDVGMAAEIEKLDVGLEFQNPLPDNLKEMIEMLTSATGGDQIMSRDTAVSKNPLVSNHEEEVTKIKSEQDEGAVRANNVLQGANFNMPEGSVA
jgi:SPP1 family phage portal protein